MAESINHASTCMHRSTIEPSGRAKRQSDSSLKKKEDIRRRPTLFIYTAKVTRWHNKSTNVCNQLSQSVTARPSCLVVVVEHSYPVRLCFSFCHQPPSQSENKLPIWLYVYTIHVHVGMHVFIIYLFRASVISMCPVFSSVHVNVPPSPPVFRACRVRWLTRAYVYVSVSVLCYPAIEKALGRKNRPWQFKQSFIHLLLSFLLCCPSVCQSLTVFCFCLFVSFSSPIWRSLQCLASRLSFLRTQTFYLRSPASPSLVSTFFLVYFRSTCSTGVLRFSYVCGMRCRNKTYLCERHLGLLSWSFVIDQPLYWRK